MKRTIEGAMCLISRHMGSLFFDHLDKKTLFPIFDLLKKKSVAERHWRFFHPLYKKHNIINVMKKERKKKSLPNNPNMNSCWVYLALFPQKIDIFSNLNFAMAGHGSDLQINVTNFRRNFFENHHELWFLLGSVRDLTIQPVSASSPKGKATSNKRKGRGQPEGPSVAAIREIAAEMTAAAAHQADMERRHAERIEKCRTEAEQRNKFFEFLMKK